MKNDISLLIIAKNEEMGLEKAVDSCRSFVDEVIIAVDDQSIDKTLEVAKRVADRVIEYTWEGSFAKAREDLQKHAKTKWVLFLDGHEYVSNFDNLAEQLKTDADGIFVKIVMETGFTFYFPRIIRKEIKWNHKVHNTPSTKKNVKYENFTIAHDRINLQAKEGQEIRAKQRTEMLEKELKPDVKKDKKDARANFYLGNLYLDTKEFNKAIPYYKRVVKYGERKNQKWLALFHVGICYNEQGKYLRALYSFWKAENEQPNRWEIAKMLGTTYGLLGWTQKAVEHWVDSFKINTGKFMFNPIPRNDAETWDFISLGFATQGKMEQSKTACKQALREEKENGPGLLTFEKIRILEEVVGTEQAPTTLKDTIEVCFLVYQRPERVKDLMKQLQAQSIQNFRVTIGNNSGKILDVGDFPKDRFSVFNFGKNVGSQARFKIAKETKGNPIIFIDDDQILHPNFVEYNYRQYLKYGKKCILGWFTRTFNNESYWKSAPAVYGEEVDYVATKAMIFDRKLLDDEPTLQDIPKEFEKVEDLYMCAMARQNHEYRMIKIEPYTTEEPDGKDQYPTIDKEKAFSSLREKGFGVIADGIKSFRGFKFKIRKDAWDEQILVDEIDPVYYQMPLNPKVVVDIGAHIGGTSILAASLGAEVFAYEPEKRNFDFLKKNVELNGFKNQIHCIKKGVGNPGKRKIFLKDGNSGMGTFEKISDEGQEIDVVSVAEVFKNIKHCDLLKMDCEGAEYEFIKDLPFEKIENISFELHVGDQKGIVEFLEKHYEVRTIEAVDNTSLIVFCTPKNPTNFVMDFLSNLNVAKNALQQLAIPCFLLNGTLLEAVRGGTELQHNDVDADLGIDEKYQDRADEIIKKMSQMGFKNNLANHYILNGKTKTLQFVKAGHHTDLLFVYKQNSSAYFCSSRRPTLPRGNKEYTAYIYSRTCFDSFEKGKFRGVEFDIPANPKVFLEERYGKDWKIPNANWNYLDQRENPSLQPNFEIL